MRGSNRVQVRFPAGHPIWSYPDGQKASKIREIVDMALHADNVTLSLLNDIKAMVGDVVLRVKTIEEMLSNGQDKSEGVPGSASLDSKAINSEVVKSFLGKFRE